MNRLKVLLNSLIILGCFFFAACVSGCGHGRGEAYWYMGNFDICDAPGAQRASACAYNSLPYRNEYIVTWQDRRSGTDYNIYAVILDSSGDPVFPEIWVCDSVDNQLAPSVAHNWLNDEYLIVWEDRQSGTDYDIFAQLVDGETGLRIGSNFSISSVIDRDERVPRVIYNDLEDDYLVVWDEESVGGDTDIIGQILDGDGTPIGGPFVICDYSGDQQYPAVAFNSTYDEYLIVWMDFRYSPSESDVFGQIVDATGALVGSDFEVNADSDDQDFPAATYNPDTDTYLVVWEDYWYPDPDIWAQELYSDGLPCLDPFDITPNTAYQRKPAICYNTVESRYLVAWEDDWYAPWDIFMQKLDVYAQLVGPNRLVSDVSATHIEPAVCANTLFGEYLVTWSAQLSGDYDILGQLLH